MSYKCFSQLFLKMRMSSRYTTIKELVKGHRISSINLMKVFGEFVNPKGMTNHLKLSCLDLKVVFHTSIYYMGIWW
jgi:hypothetical protein